MARINKTPYAILAFLAKRPMSGYDIKRTAEKISRLFWSESNAQIYPALKQLEQEDLVRSKLDAKSGKRQRRIYTITATGRKHLMQWLQEKTLLTPAREDLLLKISSGFLLDKETLLQQLQHYRQQLLAELEFQQQTLTHVNNEHTDTVHQEYIFLNLDYVKRVLEAKLAWVDATIIKLSGKD